MFGQYYRIRIGLDFTMKYWTGSQDSPIRSMQNRRQKVVNRGALRLCGEALHSCRGA